MKKLLVSAGVVVMATIGLSAAAWGGPNPSPDAPAHTDTACENVLTKNQNTGPSGHIAPTGGANFAAVGATMCGGI